MRPAEFAIEQIVEAGQALQAAGRSITGFALRQKVGGGNAPRLKQIWDEHINSQAVVKVEPVAELPVEVAEEMAAVSKALNERLAGLAVQLNDKAVKAAERRVSEVIRTAGEQREQAERELADAAQTVDDLENQLDESTAKAAGLETSLAEAGTANQAQAVELAQLRERLAAAEQHAHAAAEQHAAALAELRAKLEKAEANNFDLGASYHKLQSELFAATAKAEAAEQAHQEQRKTAAQEAHRAAERMTKAEAGRDEARTEASKAREDAAKLRGQVEALQTQAGDLMNALAARQPVEVDVPNPNPRKR